MVAIQPWAGLTTKAMPADGDCSAQGAEPLPVFYSERLLADAESPSPSAHKPREVVASWLKLGIALQLLTPRPVSRRQLALAHAPDYVDAVLASQADNGFGNRLPGVARALPHVVGAVYDAATHVLATRRVALAPVGPFHLAGYRSAAADCTFNALLITALALKQTGVVQRVGIIDASLQPADGSLDIVARLQQPDWLKHAALSALGEALAADDFAALEQVVLDMADCDLLLYQASVDSHWLDVDEGSLDENQLLQRDRRLCASAAEWCIPLVVITGAGHQRDDLGKLEPVLRLHDNTLRACAEVFGCKR